MVNDLLAALRCPIDLILEAKVPQRTTWYRIWEAAVAVIGLCVIKGVNGEAHVSGQTLTQSLTSSHFQADTSEAGAFTVRSGVSFAPHTLSMNNTTDNLLEGSVA